MIKKDKVKLIKKMLIVLLVLDVIYMFILFGIFCKLNKGDIDGNGVKDMWDVYAISLYFNGNQDATLFEKFKMDVNYDFRIDKYDCLKLEKQLGIVWEKVE